MALDLRSCYDSLLRASPPLLLAVGLERLVAKALVELSDSTGVRPIPLSSAFGARLLELTPRERTRTAARVFRELLSSHQDDIMILDRTAILFLPELMLNPLPLLIETSRSFGPIAAAWCGEWDGTALTYSRPGHPEYHRYSHPTALVVSIT